MRVAVFSDNRVFWVFPEPHMELFKYLVNWVPWRPDLGPLPSSESSNLWFALHFGKPKQVKIALYLWEMFECKRNNATLENSHGFPPPQRFEKVLWSMLLFLLLPDSYRLHSSWCAVQEITFGVFVFPGSPWLWFCFWMFSACSKLEGSKFSVCRLPAISCWEHLVTKWVPNILKHACDSNTRTCLHLIWKQRSRLFMLGVFSPRVETMCL